MGIETACCALQQAVFVFIQLAVSIGPIRGQYRWQGVISLRLVFSGQCGNFHLRNIRGIRRFRGVRFFRLLLAAAGIRCNHILRALLLLRLLAAACCCAAVRCDHRLPQHQQHRQYRQKQRQKRNRQNVQCFGFDALIFL